MLGGVRGSFHTPISWLTPYAELAAGRTSTNATEPSCETTAGAIYLCQGGVTTASPRKFDSFVQYEAFGGIDLHVLPIVDLRVIEFGVGNMNRIGSGYGSSSVGVISVGCRRRVPFAPEVTLRQVIDVGARVDFAQATHALAVQNRERRSAFA